jgi:hypothetical protein
MYDPNHPAYKQSVAIKLGRTALAPEYQQLVDWLSQLYTIPVLNYYYYIVETSKHYRQQHIILITETNSDAERLEEIMKPDEIISGFQMHFNTHVLSGKDPLKRDVLPAIDGKFPDTVIVCCALEAVELKKAYASASTAISALAAQYEELWLISANGPWHTVFYYTTAQIGECESNGISASIRNDILTLLRRHDRFGYFGSHSLTFVQFDSKEALDLNFQGNMYYYYK